MPTHHCIGNPCTICFPPSNIVNPYFNQAIDSRYFTSGISDSLRSLLIDVFKRGIEHNAHFGGNESPTQIKEERAKISSDSFEAKLLDLIIEDFEKPSEPY
jgi:hypothetical protein